MDTNNKQTTQADENFNEKTPSTVQQPGEVIRPFVGEGEVEEIVLRTYGLKVESIKELNSYDDRNYMIKVSSEHSNDHIKELHPHGYVVKIQNSKDSKNPAVMDAQHAFMACLIKHNIQTQHPVPNLRGDFYSLETIYSEKGKTGSCGQFLFEIRTFIPGRIIQDVPYTPSLLYEDGRLMANMALALKDFDHPFYKNRDFLWSLTNVPLLTQFTFCLKSQEDRDVVEDVVANFNTHVVTSYDILPRGYIHGDPNEQNILVTDDPDSPEGSSQHLISGILDFSDVNNSYPILDLAMNIAYMMIDSQFIDQLDTPGHILAGYLTIRPLTECEWDVLRICIAARLTQSLTLGAHANYIEPENTYVLTTAARGWPLLHKFWSHPKEELMARWKTIIDSYKA